MVRFWRVGEASTWCPPKKYNVYPRLGENVLNPSHFPVVPYDICWMTNRWFYQHGSFVVSSREKRLEISLQKHSLNFFQNSGLKWEGNFPDPVNLPIHQRIDIKTSLGYLFTTGTLCMAFYDTLKFPCRNIPGDFLGKIGGNIHIENSPSFLLDFCRGNYEEISKAMIPWNSPIIPCGNLADVDGLPAGLIAF